MYTILFADTYENIVFRFDGRVVSNIFHRRVVELFRASFPRQVGGGGGRKKYTETKSLARGVSSSINCFR